MDSQEELHDIFSRKTKELLKSQKKSMRSTSKKVAGSETWLRNPIDPDAKREPGSFKVANLAMELGVTPNELLGMTDKFEVDHGFQNRPSEEMMEIVRDYAEQIKEEHRANGQKISSKSLIRWHKDTGGRIEALGSLMRFADLYEVPDASDAITKPVILGSDSLASNTLQDPSVQKLRYVLQAFVKADQERLVAAYSRAKTNGMDFSVETINVYVPQLDQWICYEYFRSLFDCRDQANNKYILNCSEFIRCCSQL